MTDGQGRQGAPADYPGPEREGGARQAAERHHRGGHLAGILAIALALVVILGALPRAIADAMLTGHRDVMALIAAGRPVDRLTLAAAVEAHYSSLAWHEDPAVLSTIGALELARAQMVPRPPSDVRQALLRDSVSASGRSAELRPANPFVWTRIAQAALILETLSNPSDAVVPALDMALRIAPDEPRLFGSRSAVALAVWDRLTEEQQNLAADQIRAYGREDVRGLAALARQTFSLTTVLDLVADVPELRQGLRRAVLDR